MSQNSFLNLTFNWLQKGFNLLLSHGPSHWHREFTQWSLAALLLNKWLLYLLKKITVPNLHFNSPALLEMGALLGYRIVLLPVPFNLILPCQSLTSPLQEHLLILALWISSVWGICSPSTPPPDNIHADLIPASQMDEREILYISLVLFLCLDFPSSCLFLLFEILYHMTTFGLEPQLLQANLFAFLQSCFLFCLLSLST